MSQDDSPTVCVHMMLERIDEDSEKESLDIDGHGTLVPYFRCCGCGALLFALMPSVGLTSMKSEG